MKEKNLPLYGVGPIYVYVIALIEIIGIALSYYDIIPVVSQGILKLPCRCLGGILIVANIVVWIYAAILSKLDDHIKNNELVVSGIYAYVRNPIYSAITFALFGVLLIYGNVILLPLLSIGFILNQNLIFFILRVTDG